MKTNTSGWLVSRGVRASYATDGALLLDVKKGVSYRLNALAAQAWLTIEGSPEGITLDGIVGALQTHFEIPLMQLKSDTADWLDRLKQLGLLRQANGEVLDFKE